MTSTATNKQIAPLDGSNTKSDFYGELKQSKDINSLKLQIVKVIKRLGLSDFSFVPLERDWDYENQQGVLSTYPDEYWRIFQEDQLHTHDMLISFFRENAHPSHTSHIYNYYCDAPFDCEITRVNRAIRQLQHAFGFFENYAIPITTNDGNGTFLFTLSQQNMSPAAFQAQTNCMASELRSLGQAIHTVCNTKFPTHFERPAKKVVDIAPKPLRVLATLANGDSSITDVASKLCISPITAHQHIAAARRALNKNTNIGAIKEAIGLGLIKYDYDK